MLHTTRSKYSIDKIVFTTSFNHEYNTLLRDN
uniref:Uncharacterized protein n=1 Tax=Rhizophora mucronata TaxID=61149 RepID=A0A2P2P713_RHIMU